MFFFRHTFNPAPSYQTTRGALYTARRLTPRQRWLLMICDGRVTQADLVKATRLSTGKSPRRWSFCGGMGWCASLGQPRGAKGAK